MMRLPNRLAGMIPARTILHTVAVDISSSFATCFVVMNLFVILDLTPIYTRTDSDASIVGCEFAARRSWVQVGWKVFPLWKLFPFVFPFRLSAKCH